MNAGGKIFGTRVLNSQDLELNGAVHSGEENVRRRIINGDSKSLPSVRVKKKFSRRNIAIAAAALCSVAYGVNAGKNALEQQWQIAKDQAVAAALKNAQPDINATAVKKAVDAALAKQQPQLDGAALEAARQSAASTAYAQGKTEANAGFQDRLKRAEQDSYYAGQRNGFAANTCRVVNNMSRNVFWGAVSTEARASTCAPDSSKLHPFVFQPN